MRETGRRIRRQLIFPGDLHPSGRPEAEALRGILGRAIPSFHERTGLSGIGA
jgi:hypothetical protein